MVSPLGACQPRVPLSRQGFPVAFISLGHRERKRRPLVFCKERSGSRGNRTGLERPQSAVRVGAGGLTSPCFHSFCPVLLCMQMIESECFRDISESENDENVALVLEKKTCQPVPNPKRGFFYRLLRRRVKAGAGLGGLHLRCCGKRNGPQGKDSFLFSCLYIRHFAGPKSGAPEPSQKVLGTVLLSGRNLFSVPVKHSAQAERRHRRHSTLQPLHGPPDWQLLPVAFTGNADALWKTDGGLDRLSAVPLRLEFFSPSEVFLLGLEGCPTLYPACSQGLYSEVVH